MEGCRVADVSLMGCDMKGLESDRRWWADADEQDPFIFYLNEVLDAFTERRPGSSSVRSLAGLIDALSRGQGTRDWYGDFEILDEIAERIRHP